MKPVAEIWIEDPELALDLLRERAAIIQEGEGCGRWMAETLAARDAGFKNFVDATSKIKRQIRINGSAKSVVDFPAKSR